MGRIKTAGLQHDPRSGIWTIDKRVRGYGRLYESTGSRDLKEAETYLHRRLEQIRQASVYGVRAKRKWREAATRYLLEEAIDKDSGADDVYRLKLLDPFLGERDLHQIHDGTLTSFIAWRRQPVKVKRKSGKVWVKQVKTKTINLDLSLVRRILNLAARKWRDEQGLTWLETAPLISMLKVRDARAPYPLSWAEQRLLLPELPEHLAELCLFLLNTGLRSKSEAVRLDWRWEIVVPELNCSVFLVPGDARKNEQDHVCVLNSVARSIVERCRGKHSTAVFTYRGRPLNSVNNTAWVTARASAVAKYEERWASRQPRVLERCTCTSRRSRTSAHARMYCRSDRTSGFGSHATPVFRRNHRDYFLLAICARRRSSCFRSSGVSSAPKSSASNTCRISISDSPGKGLGQRLTQSIASSFDFTCHNQKPAISSLVSVNGPSITVRFAPENLTRAPFELGWSPSPASIMPAFTSSSLNLPMSSRSFVSGRTPASDSFVALTITMNRIVHLHWVRVSAES